MEYIYLDLNVFDRLEKFDKLTPQEAEYYKCILDCLESGEYNTLYSDAHINDLIRAHNNSLEDLTKFNNHLQYISGLTNNQCICLYGGHTDVKFEPRDISEFFHASLEDSKVDYGSFDSLLGDSSQISNTLIDLMEKLKNLLGGAITPEIIEKALEYPFYQKILSKTSETMDGTNLPDDILTASTKLEDPKIYRELKNLLNPNNLNDFIKALPESQQLSKKELKEIFQNFDLNAAFEQYAPKTKTSENLWYDKITNLYAQIDFKGFKTDKYFANMLDDANHTFYGAHFPIFITNDDGCHYKATEVYKHFGIPTKVMKPSEFYEHVNSQNVSKE